MTTHIIGIDPGADGAMAILSPGHLLTVYPFKNKTWRDIADDFIPASFNPKNQVYLEKVGAMPGQGTTSMFTFGKNVGFLIGLFTAYKEPWEEVTPQTWQKALSLGFVKGGKTQRKNAHKAKAQALFPGHHITLATCDAVLIAEYGYRKQYGGLN